MEQGQSLATSFDPLVQRQAVGCKTSDFQQGEENPRHRWRAMERRPSQMAGCLQPVPTWLQGSTTETDLYTEEKWQKASFIHPRNEGQSDAGIV